MGLEEQLLATAIREGIAAGEAAATQLGRLQAGSTLSNVDEGEHADKMDEARHILSFKVAQAFRDTMILAERLGLPLLRADIAKDRSRFKKQFDAINLDPEGMHWISAPLSTATLYFNSMATMTQGRALTGLSVLETVLGNTAKIIAHSGLEPSSEKEVRDAVRATLSFAFPDVVREMSIVKSFKTYKPDIGVMSLMAAAEYKFVDSREEAKKALDEIYTDMKGYRGSFEWRSFYAVLYMTDAFYTQKDVDHEWRLVKAESSWTPIVIHGRGGRKPKAGRPAGSGAGGAPKARRSTKAG